MKKEFIENMTQEDVIDAALASVDNVSDLVEKLVDIRKASGLTQKDVAKFMGVKQSAVARFENMLVIPKANTVCLYAAAVGERIELRSEKKKEQNITLYVFKKETEFFSDENFFDLNKTRVDDDGFGKITTKTSCLYRA